MAFNNAVDATESGFQSITSSGVWHGRTLTAGTGISISNGDGTAGNPTITNISSFTPNSTIQLFDDFIGSFPSAPLTSNLPWITGGFAWFNANTTGDSGHPGVISSTSLTSSSQFLFLGMTVGNAVSAQIILGGGAITLNWVIKLATLSTGTNTYTLRCGLGDTKSADEVNGVYFEYTNGTNSGQWQFKTAAASSRTTSSSAIAADTSYHNFSITINAAGTSCAFFIDGVSLGTAIATNIPTAGITPFVDIVWSAGTIPALSVLVDLMYFTQTLTTPR